MGPPPAKPQRRVEIPPPPRIPDIRFPAVPPEEITPVSTSTKAGAVPTSGTPDSGVTVGSGKKKIHVGTATIVAVIAALAAGYGGRATAGTDASGGLQEDLRELRKDIRYIRTRVDRIEDRLEKAANAED